MDNNNKYRKHPKEHFYEAKNSSPLIENKHGQRPYKELESRIRKEKINTSDDIEHLFKETFSMEKTRHHYNDNNHRQCPCQNRHCASKYEQQLQRAKEVLSRKYCNGDCPGSRHHQNSCQQSPLRGIMEPELSPRYSPKLRNYGDALSHSTRKQERQEEKGGEDFILYKNLTFGEPPSSKSEHGGDDGNKQKTTFQSNHQNHKKDSKNYLEAAKAQCHAAGERFQRQLAHSSESSSSKNTKSKLSKVTVISAKSGDDLRAAVRLQIEEQEALHKLSMMEKRRKEEVVPDGKNINQKLDPKPEDVLKPHLNSDDLQHIDCSISSDDLVCTKVIEPMMRKIQRMYLYTLKEEMSLMDYLGTVPKLVRDIYKQEPAEKDEKKI